MGLTALGPGVATGASTTGLSATAAVGASVGSVYATAALVYTLAYLNVLGAAERDYRGLRWSLIAATIALMIVFATTVLFTVGNVIARVT